MKLNKSMWLLAMMGLIAFLFSSCEKEEIHQLNNQKNNISFEEFKKEVIQNKFDHYLLIPSKRINNLAKNKTIDEFIIDTTFVKKHINSFDKNISTYSLKIYPKDFTKSPSIFYNLVYYKSGQQWNHRIIEITRSTHKSKKYESIITLYNSGIDINSTTSRICTSEATYYHCTGCTDVCDECGLCVTVQTNVESCPDTPAEFTVVDGDGGNNFQTGNTGGGSGDSNFDYFIFYNDLNQQQKDWIANNQDSFNDIVNYLNQNNYSIESKNLALQIINSKIDGIDDDKVCLGSFDFSDVGNTNWQNAGMSNVNVQFLTIGSIIGFVNAHFLELHFGLPKQKLNGEYITNNNARYIGQEIMTKAEILTNTYQSLNPSSSAIQIKSYFLSKMQEIAREYGGTVSTYPPLGWSGTLRSHQSYIISSGIECD